MRFGALVLLLGLTLTAAMPASAGDTGPSGNKGPTGVTVWRGAPGDWQRGTRDADLAVWIRHAHDRIGTGATSPIPKDIQKRFRHAFPAGLFDWARFGVSADERLWRQAARRGFGSALVLVLDDIILFRTVDASRSHTAWYDGLAQAQSFRRFGVEKALSRRQTAQPRTLGADGAGAFSYPYSLLGRRLGAEPEADVSEPGRPVYGPGPITVPGKVTVPGPIIVKPANPFQND